MTRDQAHRIPRPPSNLRTGSLSARPLPDRLDPGYDVPGPMRRSELTWALVLKGIFVFALIAAFVVAVSIQDVRP